MIELIQDVTKQAIGQLSAEECKQLKKQLSNLIIDRLSQLEAVGKIMALAAHNDELSNNEACLMGFFFEMESQQIQHWVDIIISRTEVEKHE